MTTNLPLSAASTNASQPFTLLVPLDGSPLAEQALSVAMPLCRALAGRIELIRALPYPIEPVAAMGGYMPGDIYQQLEDDQRQLAEGQLKPLVASLRSQGLSADLCLEDGQPAAVILDEAERLPANLIVMTTHGRTGLARFALGSVADRVVRGGHVPVLLVRSFAKAAAAPTLQTALIPLDGTPLAARALDIACQLAGPVLREITLLTVVDPHADEPALTRAHEYLDLTRDQLLKRLANDSCVVNTEICTGSPADSILAAAVQRDDLIIMATHGSAGIGRWVVGTVTDRVLRGGQTPLLLVHPAHGEAEHER